MAEWLPFLVPVFVAAIAYFGGRYQVRQTTVTATSSAEQTRLDARDERLWDQMQADNARLIVERDYWRGLFLESIRIAEKAADRAEHPKEPSS